MMENEALELAKFLIDIDMPENSAFPYEERSKTYSSAFHEPEISYKHFDDYMSEESQYPPQVTIQVLDNENILYLKDDSYLAEKGAMAESGALFSTDWAQTISLQEPSGGGDNVGHYAGDVASVFPDDIEEGTCINGQQDPLSFIQSVDDISIFEHDGYSNNALSDATVHFSNPDQDIFSKIMSKNDEIIKLAHSSAGTFSRPIQEFLKFVPLLNKTRGNNFGDLFVEVLLTRSHKIPLDDFYILLHQFAKCQTIGKTLKPVSEEFQLCHLILEAFKKPFVVPGHPHTNLVQNKHLFSLNRYELLRTFLTIKIMFDMVEAVDEMETNVGIPRNSMYKAYYIIWHRLHLKHLKASSSIQTEPKVLTSSQFGKLIKSVHPFLKFKRLGKRGKSAFHYTNAKWNEEIIDEEIKHLLHFGLPDLDAIFMNKKRESQTSNSSSDPTNSAPNISTINLQVNSDLPASILVPKSKKSLYSFLDSSMLYPTHNCILRPWEVTFGQSPQQSKWARETMQKSIEALRANSIDISPLSLLSHGKEITLEVIDEFLRHNLQLLSCLIEVSAAPETFLNFFMVVALLLFPIAFASNKEVTPDLKESFRQSLTEFVNRIEFKVSGVSPRNRKDIMSFAKILRKMISANKVLSTCVPTKLVRRIMKVMTGSFQQAVDPQTALKEQEAMFEIVSRGVIMSCNALNWEFVDETFRVSSGYRSWFVSKVSDAYMNTIISVLAQISQIPGFMTERDWENPTYELPHDIFMRSFKIYSENFIREALVLKLPMRIVEMMVVNITNEFQTTTYHRYGELELELSKESFKVWWVYSMVVQEYMSIVSEIFALHYHVSSPCIQGPRNSRSFIRKRQIESRGD